MSVAFLGLKEKKPHCTVRDGHGVGGYTKCRDMSDTQYSNRDQELYAKSVYLRVYSSELLAEARELCQTSGKLRKTIASLNYEMRILRSVGFFSGPNYPSGQIWATSWGPQLVNFNGGLDGNYRVANGSSWKNAASDGKDVGADVDGAEGATANSPTGNWPTP